MPDGAEVEGNDVVEIVVGPLQDRLGFGAPGVVHENIDATELPQRRANQLLARRNIRDVSRQSQSASPKRLNLLGRRLERLRTAPRQHNVRAVLGENQRRAPSNARATTGDDGDPAVKVELFVHVTAPLQVHLGGTPSTCTSVQHMLYGRTGTEGEERRLSDLYYDPWNIEIDLDPYPVYRRLRDEAPLYYNERHDFWAISRYADVDGELRDPKRLSSAKGDIHEVVKADPVMPPGVFINEDPPLHTIHRALVSRAFMPKKMRALEDKIRAFCVACLDPLVGGDRLDSVADLGAQLPMRPIGLH